MYHKRVVIAVGRLPGKFFRAFRVAKARTRHSGKTDRESEKKRESGTERQKERDRESEGEGVP